MSPPPETVGCRTVELVPESKQSGNVDATTMPTLAGSLVMMMLDAAFG
jgi:hypothetical protein